MIYTVTINPAIDYIMHLTELKTGKINRSFDENPVLGGKGINVSLVLKELGNPSVATGFIAGFTGRAIMQGLNNAGVENDFVELPQGLTRINVKLRSDNETDINAKGPEISKADIKALTEKLDRLKDGDCLVLAGNVPSALPADTYAELIAALKGNDIRTVVDAEGEQLLKTLKYRPFLIKPNEEELFDLFGVNGGTKEDIVKYANELQKLGAQNVLVSMGADGAMLLDRHGNTHFAEAVKGKPINTVGAGDSMVAGFISGFIKTADYAYALKLGTAAGAATAFSEGLADRDKIMRIERGIC